MTLAGIKSLLFPGSTAVAPPVSVAAESGNESSDTVRQIPTATPARKVLDPAIAAHEAAITQGQALLASGILGHRRYI